MPTKKQAMVKIQKADDSFICLPVKDPNFDSSADSVDVTTTCSPEGIKQSVAGLLSTSMNANGFFEQDATTGAMKEAQKIMWDAYFKGNKKVVVQYFPDGDEMLGYQQEFIVTSWSHSGAIGTPSEVASQLQGSGALTFLNEV